MVDIVLAAVSELTDRGVIKYTTFFEYFVWHRLWIFVQVD